jgi:hypothetical protein
VLRVTIAVLAFCLPCLSTASAAEDYHVMGRDELAILGTSVESHTTYNGTGRLVVTVLPHDVRQYSAETHFSVENPDGAGTATASAQLTVVSADDQRISAANDPAYLTVITQPFAVALDVKTLQDLTSLRTPVPFHFLSGMTGGDLHGLLEYRGSSKIDGFETASITFDAAGPFASTLPGEPKVPLAGQIHMTGHAFYRKSDALLMKLATTLVSTGTVGGGPEALHVRVTYERELTHMARQPSPVPTPSAMPSNLPSVNPSTMPTSSKKSIAPSPSPTPVPAPPKAMPT